MSNVRSEADRDFEAYLTQYGYDFEHEPGFPEVNATRLPDYRVSRRDTVAVCEVKQFKTRRISERLARQRNAMLSDREVFGAVRNQVDAAAKQLKPFTALGVPLVVVLSNPLRADVQLDFWHLAHALHGNPQAVIPIGPDGDPAGPAREQAGRDGAITTKHRYVSAVVALHRRPDQELVIDTYDIAQGRATALPGDFFDGPLDARYGFIGDDGTFGSVRPPTE
jgi:hypothetical protein